MRGFEKPPPSGFCMQAVPFSFALRVQTPEHYLDGFAHEREVMTQKMLGEHAQV